MNMKQPYPHIVCRDLANGQDREVTLEPTGWFKCEIRNFSDWELDGTVVWFPKELDAQIWAEKF
jgi:hypothetical protein